MTMTTERSLYFGTNECPDGTICENKSNCMPHPYKEGSYMCDCLAEAVETNVAGIYCEHKATSTCGHDLAFCTNGGDCIVQVGKNEEHAGCKCPKGYEGNYCQFIQGSMPSDWTLDNYMHPALITAYNTNDNSGANVLGIVVGAGIGFVVIAGILIMYLYCGFEDLRAKLRRTEKELDTARGDVASANAASSEFIGGKSVYKKKTSTGHFVTPDSLEADGGVLQDALGEHPQASMEEVDLDADADGLPASSLGGGSGEMA